MKHVCSTGEHIEELPRFHVPVRHFGVILPLPEWRILAAELRDRGMPFLIEPTRRFIGQPGEQATMFFEDPSGNALEIKAFADESMVFAK